MHLTLPISTKDATAKCEALSRWIDNHFFPLPDGYDERYHQLDIAQQAAERDANKILACINSCERLGQFTAIDAMKRNYMVKYGNTPQVVAQLASLDLAYNYRYLHLLKTTL